MGCTNSEKLKIAKELTLEAHVRSTAFLSVHTQTCMAEKAHMVAASHRGQRTEIQRSPSRKGHTILIPPTQSGPEVHMELPSCEYMHVWVRTEIELVEDPAGSPGLFIIV